MWLDDLQTTTTESKKRENLRANYQRTLDSNILDKRTKISIFTSLVKQFTELFNVRWRDNDRILRDWANEALKKANELDK